MRLSIKDGLPETDGVVDRFWLGLLLGLTEGIPDTDGLSDGLAFG